MDGESTMLVASIRIGMPATEYKQWQDFFLGSMRHGAGVLRITIPEATAAALSAEQRNASLKQRIP